MTATKITVSAIFFEFTATIALISGTLLQKTIDAFTLVNQKIQDITQAPG